MRKNKTFPVWYESKKSELERALNLVSTYERNAKELYTKKLACKNYEQTCLFKLSFDVAVASRGAYENTAYHIKQILLDALNMHYARIIARSFKLEDCKIKCQKKDYIAATFINRENHINEIDEMFKCYIKED